MKRSVNHATITIERTYDAAPERVFAAFADTTTKRRWFAEGESWKVEQFDLDFRVGGAETSRFRFKDGPAIRNDTVFHDIVPGERIVFAYAMTVGDSRISVSLTTIELSSSGRGGTRLAFTEQGAFLDGHDDGSKRKQGWGGLLDALGKELGSRPNS